MVTSTLTKTSANGADRTGHEPAIRRVDSHPLASGNQPLASAAGPTVRNHSSAVAAGPSSAQPSLAAGTAITARSASTLGMWMTQDREIGPAAAAP